MAKLPAGAYEADGFLDDDGITDQPIRLAAKITIENDNIVFDLSGTSLQRRAPMNSTYAQTFSSCAYFLRCLADPDLPVNAGYYQALRVIAALDASKSQGGTLPLSWPRSTNPNYPYLSAQHPPRRTCLFPTWP